MHDWLQSVYGAQFLGVEKAATDKAMRSLTGPTVLLIGDGIDQEKLRDLGLPHLINLSQSAEQQAHHSLASDGAFLPFADGSFSSVLLPHVLEVHTLPHQVLREAHRVLQADGHLLLSCFNRLSLLGTQRLLRQKAVPQGEYYSLSRVKDWLHLLGFEVVASAMYHYAPLTRSPLLIRRLEFLNSVGDRWFPLLGGSYVLTARKRELGMRLVGKVKSHKRRKPSLVPSPARRVENNKHKNNRPRNDARNVTT